MGSFNVPGGFWSDPRLMEVPNSAVGLWTKAGSYVAQHETGGHVPRHVIGKLFGARKRDVDALVESGLWVAEEGGYCFADEQVTREQADEKRRRDAERKARSRAKRNAESRPDLAEDAPETRPEVAENSPDPRPDPAENPPETRLKLAENSPESRPGSAPLEGLFAGQDVESQCDVRVTSRGGARVPARPSFISLPTRDLSTEEETNNAGAGARETPTPRRSKAQTDEQFDRFYTSYPRKKEPRRARKAWDTAVKSGADPEQVIAGAQRYAEVCQQAQTESRFIKHPATWLNAGCWEDEPDPAPLKAAAGEYRAWQNPTDPSVYWESL